MAKRDFLILMIKLFGLYSAVTTIFSTLPNIVLSVQYMDTLMIIWVIGASLVVGGLFWLLTFKADKIVDLLKLDKGFADNNIELANLKATDILSTGIFIIGGLMIVRTVPALLSQLYWAFKGEIAGQEFIEEDKFNLTVSALNLLIGYLLFTNYNVVASRMSVIKSPR
jgi:hypothetical protein